MISNFKIESDFVPRGDQPEAINALAENIKNANNLFALGVADRTMYKEIKPGEYKEWKEISNFAWSNWYG